MARRSLLDGASDRSAGRRPADRGVRGRRQSLTVMLRPARPKRPARPHSRLSSMLSPSLVIGQDHGRTRRRQPVRYHEHQPKGEPETSNDSLHRTASLWWVTENPLLCDATPRTPIPNSHGTAPREDPGAPMSGHWALGTRILPTAAARALRASCLHLSPQRGRPDRFGAVGRHLRAGGPCSRHSTSGSQRASTRPGGPLLRTQRGPAADQTQQSSGP